eukprot:CAMPEP_0181296180 /NCGR_PEP_ID=MMETSP1101-20121128/4559_1 /TAXON_ID=46948 /ORGANISM="Rhodomonas abbreviata, Strain Caron Lab Isolate" /LENGTH=94 /DNA_ID=CAMNT_0023401013 /DNA_START=233 /DNA_END=513 /DNA_ORIENTATION=-
MFTVLSPATIILPKTKSALPVICSTEYTPPVTPIVSKSSPESSNFPPDTSTLTPLFTVTGLELAAVTDPPSTISVLDVKMSSVLAPTTTTLPPL